MTIQIYPPEYLKEGAKYPFSDKASGLTTDGYRFPLSVISDLMICLPINVVNLRATEFSINSSGEAILFFGSSNSTRIIQTEMIYPGCEDLIRLIFMSDSTVVGQCGVATINSALIEDIQRLPSGDHIFQDDTNEVVASCVNPGPSEALVGIEAVGEMFFGELMLSTGRGAQLEPVGAQNQVIVHINGDPLHDFHVESGNSMRRGQRFLKTISGIEADELGNFYFLSSDMSSVSPILRFTQTSSNQITISMAGAKS